VAERGRRPPPGAVLFDVNETLSDLSPLVGRFEDVGLSGQLAAAWFAGLLRDGFALTVVGATPRFAELGRGTLRTLLTAGSAPGDLDAAVEHVMSGFLALPVHPDVVPGVRALRAAGVRLATLSNGAPEVAEALLARAGLRDEIPDVLSVESGGPWKPAPAAYRRAAAALRVPGDALMLVAVHPWDVDGAARAGLRTAWVNRGAVPYPPYFTRPEVEARDLVDLAAQISG
jgi:2-haloacid dehalogenase